MERKDKINLLKLLLGLALLSGLLTLISFSFATGYLDLELIKSYFRSSQLLILNFLPIFMVMALAYGLTNRLGLSFLLTSGLVVVGGLANRAKIIYRDDPLVMADLSLITEARMMSQRYEIPISARIVMTALGLVALALIIRKFFNYRLESKKLRLAFLLVFLGLSSLGLKNIYLDDGLYDSLGDMELINRWIESERHQAKGFIYPFTHSAKDLLEEKPEGYSPKRAQEILASYQYEDIEPGRKVNIIGIMLEAYNDFSKFEGLEIDPSVYRDFHRLEQESVHGRIVTNIFAGGTVDTERAYLTGYRSLPKFNKETNSFAWYFKEQGYRTEAMHPVTGSFYNRRNINEYLGFDNFYHGDNFYESESYLEDSHFLPTIIEGFDRAKEEGLPYFNYSLTYQNHGPYSREAYHQEDLLGNKGAYDEDLYNIFNNYLYGVRDTGQELAKFIDHFRQEEEPVVIVLFGDHNPWLGEGNSVYKMLGIDMNLENPQGFRNYYETPYLIWGNDRAKEVLDRDLVGAREEIGSNYLMAQVFEELGYGGNPYMQFIKELKKDLPVQHRLFFKEGGSYKKELDRKQDSYKDYINIEYFYSRNR